MYPVLSNSFKIFYKASTPFQMYPIVSKYIQKFYLTFKAPKKDNTKD